MGISNIHDALEGEDRLDTAVACIDEPQHPRDELHAFEEHGQEWVECLRCGRQWSIDDCDAEVVTEGDGHCDENPASEP